MDKTNIKCISLVTIYVDNYLKSYNFYAKVLGLEKKQNMGEKACLFKIGEKHQGLYLDGGNKPKIHADSAYVHVSCVLRVESAIAMFNKLKKFDTKIIQDKPVFVNDDDYWFMFYDPAGNILEVIGKK